MKDIRSILRLMFEQGLPISPRSWFLEFGTRLDANHGGGAWQAQFAGEAPVSPKPIDRARDGDDALLDAAMALVGIAIGIETAGWRVVEDGIARGLDTREVQPDHERKSIGAEDTFPEDVFELEAAREQLLPLVSKVCRFCSNNDTGGKTVTLKVKYSDFQTITRSRTLPIANRTEASVWMVLEPLLQSVFPTRKVSVCSVSALAALRE